METATIVLISIRLAASSPKPAAAHRKQLCRLERDLCLQPRHAGLRLWIPLRSFADSEMVMGYRPEANEWDSTVCAIKSLLPRSQSGRCIPSGRWLSE